MLRRRSLGSDCCGWSGLSRFCAHTNSNASARVDRGADGDTCFDPDVLALPNCCSNANSAAPSDSCSHIGARAHPSRRAYKLDPVSLSHKAESSSMLSLWIPAFAGMTANVAVFHTLSGWS